MDQICLVTQDQTEEQTEGFCFVLENKQFSQQLRLYWPKTVKLGVFIKSLKFRVNFMCLHSRAHSKLNLQVYNLVFGEHLSQVRLCAKV